MSQLFRVAIDGPAASGKSTTAKLLARTLGFGYIDTGAMFRAITLKCQVNHIDLSDPSNKEKIVDIARHSHICFPSLDKVELDGEDVSNLIRSTHVTRNINPVASNSSVRSILCQQQRDMAKGIIPGVVSTGFVLNNKCIKGVVMDGRDIGTVVLPDAELKVFIEADIQVRAQRRYDEMKSRLGDKGMTETLKDVQEDLRVRDHNDRTREVSPLKKAEDAYMLDTTYLTLQEQVNTIRDWVYKTVDKNHK
ncbi:cytidylate kinase [Pilobolus umbonatus]|nr:cytidylate kinase [Pilobolus umbonatus]